MDIASIVIVSSLLKNGPIKSTLSCLMLIKPWVVIFRVVGYLFFGIERLFKKKELFGVSFILFLDSINMKRLLSEIAFFHTH